MKTIKAAGLTAIISGLVAFAFMTPLAPTKSHAANLYTINSGQTITINEHGTCRKVRNNTNAKMMVPTRTAGEWSQFISRAGGVTISPCCSGVGGYCWHIAASPSQGCDDVCASRGGVNMTGTRNYAGSGGNNTNCRNVLLSLGQAIGAVGTASCSEGWGCMIMGGYGAVTEPGHGKIAIGYPKNDLATKADFGSSSCGGSLSCSNGDDGGSSSATAIRCTKQTETWSDYPSIRRACACNS